MSKKKRRNKSSNKPHPNKSFEQYVADATLNKFSNYIQGQIFEYGKELQRSLLKSFENIYVRISAIEDLLVDKLEGVDKETLVELVADIQDESLGFEKTDAPIKEGDRVRVEVQAKEHGQEEFQEPARYLVDSVGSGTVLAKPLEEDFIGKSAGDSGEYVLGDKEEEQITVAYTIKRVSVQTVQPEEEAEKNGID